ncbi:MAG: hypothetical protein LBU45_07565 [Azoarcus sp.]|jgi:hypothetical protein|nr:hypothetical protein [Azoarcus sp.]
MSTPQSPLFESTHAALTFAFHFSGQNYQRPVMNRMVKNEPSGKGLGGLDGAAQAGMIRAEVSALGRIAEAVITARYAPATLDCSCRAPCCCRHKPNPEWRNAIATIADHMRTTALAGCTTTALMRRDYVIRYFSGHPSIDALSARHGLHRDSVSAHVAKVSRALYTKKGGGLENEAFSAVDARMKACGMVNDLTYT